MFRFTKPMSRPSNAEGVDGYLCSDGTAHDRQMDGNDLTGCEV